MAYPLPLDMAYPTFCRIQRYLEEEVADTMAKTMEQYMSKSRADYGSGVARPKIEDIDNFKLKGQFLKELHQVMLRAFPVSLTRAASRWLRNKPSGSITTWEDLKTKFLSKYCPPARTVKKMEEINNFMQVPDENLYQAWERFKELLMKVGKEKIIFKSVNPASSLVKRVYMLSLRERIELDLEARLMGETLGLNRSLDPLFGDYIELNDLNVPLELRRDQVNDLMPTIVEGEAVEKFRARNDAKMTRRRSKQRIKEFNLGELSAPIVTMVDQRTMAQLLQAPTEGYEDEIVVSVITADNFEHKHGLLTIVQNKQLFGRNRRRSKQRIEEFNLDELSPPIVTIANQRTMAQLLQAPTEGYEDAIVVPDKLEYKGNNVVGALMNIPIFVGTFSILTDFAVFEDMDAYRDDGMGDVIFGELFLREVRINARRFEGIITIYNTKWCGHIRGLRKKYRLSLKNDMPLRYKTTKTPSRNDRRTRNNCQMVHNENQRVVVVVGNRETECMAPRRQQFEYHKENMLLCKKEAAEGG
nr:hypothetical protein [Tanacetum cinerariifolium]